MRAKVNKINTTVWNVLDKNLKKYEMPPDGKYNKIE